MFIASCPCRSQLRNYIKDVVSYCKEHGLVKQLGSHSEIHLG